MKVLVYTTEEDFSAQLASLRCLAALDLDRQCDYAAARESFELNRHPLVLIEASSSDGDGLSLCRKIRAISDKDRHVIVMIAPNDDDLLHRLALQAGANEVIDRHADPDVLHVQVGNAKRRAMRLDESRLVQKATLAIQRAMDRMQLGVTITNMDGTIL